MIESAEILEGRSVSRETMDCLRWYGDQVLRWNKAINLISRSSEAVLWSRHIQDSAQVFNVATGLSGGWLDMGSGGGFPGLVVAILSKELAPDRQITLVEVDVRKSEFLKTVVRDCELNARVEVRRIEEMERQDAEVVSARALAPLVKLLGYATAHLRASGTAIFVKGANWRQEVEVAHDKWAFDYDVTPSVTDQRAVVMTVRNIKRV